MRHLKKTSWTFKPLQRRAFCGLIAAAACLGLAFAACTKKPTKKTINIGLLWAPEALDPRFTATVPAKNLSKLLFAPLFILNNEHGLEPFLAQSLEQTAPLSYKVTLRPNLRFHDGSPVRASDLSYTLASLSHKDVRSHKAARLNYIKSVTALSELSVLIELKQIHPAFLTDLSDMAIVSEAQCKGRTQQCRHELMGNGPFKLKHFDAAKETYIFEPFGHWFEGAPKETLSIRVVRNINTLLLELLHGKTDFLSANIEPAILKVLKKHKDKINITTLPAFSFRYVAMNMRGPSPGLKDPEKILAMQALADPKVRLAMAHSIDVQGIIRKKLAGYATPASGIIPLGHWAKDPGLKPPAYNPALAKKLLDEAGYPERSEKTGRFRLELVTFPNRYFKSITLIFAEHLRRVGIKVDIRIRDWPTLFQDMKRGNFELFTAQWSQLQEPDFMHWIFHSSNIPGPNKGGANRGALKDPLLDDLIIQARSTMDQEKRAVLYKAAEKRLLVTLPYIPLWYEDWLVISSKRIKNFNTDRFGSFLGLRKATISSP